MIAKIMNKSKLEKGFTLLELLIVIAIIAILSVTLILILNPIETLKKARDVQRISDLNTMKVALGLYITATSSPDLDASVSNHCLTNTSGTASTAALISYSLVAADAICAANVTEGSDVVSGATFNTSDFCRYVSAIASSVTTNDGTGWVPVSFSTFTGGSPIASLPLDPVNTISTATAPTSTDLVYRYACQNAGAGGKPGYVFELNAQLESDAYTSTDDKRVKDGGDNDSYYEVGNSVRLIGSGVNF